eukprot:1119409-Rhodomonas_salina.2
MALGAVLRDHRAERRAGRAQAVGAPRRTLVPDAERHRAAAHGGPQQRYARAAAAQTHQSEQRDAYKSDGLRRRRAL